MDCFKDPPDDWCHSVQQTVPSRWETLRSMCRSLPHQFTSFRLKREDSFPNRHKESLTDLSTMPKSLEIRFFLTSILKASPKASDVERIAETIPLKLEMNFFYRLTTRLKSNPSNPLRDIFFCGLFGIFKVLRDGYNLDISQFNPNKGIFFNLLTMRLNSTASNCGIRLSF